LRLFLYKNHILDQREFSNYVILKMLEYFPQFTEHCIAQPGDVVDIEYKSSAGLLTLWLTTRDKEITIGFSGNNNLGDFHTHMSLYGANTPDEELAEAFKLIEAIISDELTIVYSTVLGYTLRDIDEIREYQQPNELIGETKWSKL